MATRREQDRTKRQKADALAWAKERGEVEQGKPTCFETPEGFENWKPDKPGVYVVDVVDYVVGKHNARADEGQLHFESEFRQHWVMCLDAKRRPYTCLQRWKQKCPLCDKLARSKRGELDKETYKTCLGRVMHLFLLKVKTFDGKPTNDDGWKIYCVNDEAKGKGFGEQLGQLMDVDKARGQTFSSWDEGCSLRLTASTDTMEGGREYVYVSRIDFQDRKPDYQYGDLENELCCLDDLFIRKTPEQLKNVLEYGSEEGPDAEAPDAVAERQPDGEYHAPPPRPTGNGRRPGEPREPEPRSEPAFGKGDWVLAGAHGRCQVVSVDGEDVVVEDKRGRKQTVDVAECQVLDEPEAPPPSRAAKVTRSPAKEPDKLEDGEWEDEDEPAPAKPHRSKR